MLYQRSVSRRVTHLISLMLADVLRNSAQNQRYSARKKMWIDFKSAFLTGSIYN